MEDKFSSSYIQNFLKRFEVDAGTPSKDVVEPAGGGTGPGADAKSAEIFKDALAAEAEKTKQSKEEWTEHTSAAKERTKTAQAETRNVNRTITDSIKGLVSKDVQGEIKKYINEKANDAQDRATGVKNYFSKENLLKNYDGIAEKSVAAKDSVVNRTTEAAKGVLHRANEKLVTKPQEATKIFGNEVGRYFMNQGKNVIDGISAETYGFKADVNQTIANRYDVKDRGKGKDGRDRKVSWLEKKLQRIAERKGRIQDKYETYQSKANQARNASRNLRAGGR